MFFIKKLTCSQDVVDTINKGNEESNKYRISVLGLEPLCIIALCFPEDHIEKVDFQKLTITDITMYYNLQNVLVDDKENNNSNDFFLILLLNTNLVKKYFSNRIEIKKFRAIFLP